MKTLSKILSVGSMGNNGSFCQRKKTEEVDDYQTIKLMIIYCNMIFIYI